MVKIATTKAQRKLFFNLRSLKTSLGTMSQKEIHDMAKQLNVKPEEVKEMETRLSGQDLSLEPMHDDDEDWVSPIAYLTDAEAEPSKLLEKIETEVLGVENLENALSNLDDRSRRIIEARWLREDKDQATLHDLATEFSVSAERIRQIEQKAMQKMRGLLAPA